MATIRGCLAGRRAVGFFVAWGTLLTGCTDDIHRSSEAAQSVAQPMYGNPTVLAPGTAMPQGPVGIVGIAGANGGRCTGTLIRRDVVLTARHCFGGLTRAGAVGQTHFSIPGTTGQEAVAAIAATRVAWNGADYVDPDAFDEPTARYDIACVHLSAPVPLVSVPTIASVYTSSDALAHVLTIDALNGGRRAVGYGCQEWSGDYPPPLVCPNDLRRRSGAISTLLFEYEDGGWLRNEDVDEDESDVTTLSFGDSGGPLYAHTPTGIFITPTIIGVFSGTTTGVEPFNTDALFWAPTFDVGPQANGQFLRTHCLNDDADDDLVSDDNDNCTPGNQAVCDLDPESCKNFDQSDEDNDGVGDACDNCTISNDINCSLGFDCQTPLQGDLDGDGVGDACDNCVFVPNGQGDSDGDKYGDACDNCDESNPSFCSIYPDCLCRATINICISQQDDPDGDGLGGPCDTCPTVSEVNVLSNSNDRAETRELATPLGDVCDEVPLFVSHPVRQSGFAIDPPGDEQNPNDVAVFASTAGIGNMTPGQLQLPFQGRAGFRHCSCLLTNDDVLSFNECFATRCSVANPIEYESPDSSNFKRVTISRWEENADSDEDKIFPYFTRLTKPTLGATLAASFTGALSLDPYEHPDPSENNATRVGALQFVGWHWRTDLCAAGQCIDDGHGQDQSFGIWWDHVPVLGGAYASPRDSDESGRLRDHYAAIETPLFRKEKFYPPPFTESACPPWDCKLTLRRDLWRSNPDPTIVAFQDRLRGPALVVPNGALALAVQSRAVPAFDVTSELSPGVQGLLTEHRAWLTPVETGARTRILRDATHAVSIPTEWVGTSSVAEVVVGATGLGLVNDRRGAIAELTSLQSLEDDEASAPIPSNRTGARALLTLTERSVFLVGGRGPGRTPLPEIWRYLLDEQSWEPLYWNTIMPVDVLALGYDYRGGRLLVLDEVERTKTLPKLPWDKHKKTVTWSEGRLRVYDLRARTGDTLATWPRLPMFDRLGLVARDDGSFVLIGSRSIAKIWFAWRFTITSNKKLIVTGRANGHGQLLGDPINTSNGVVVMLHRKGHVEQRTLTDASFHPGSAGWEAL